MAEFRSAKMEDAPTITRLRQRIWSTTYRGIYDDEMIDNFNYAWHTARDEARIADSEWMVYIIENEGEAVGYLTAADFEKPRYKDFHLYLMSLYILQEMQGRGIGSQALELVADYGRCRGYGKFYLECHPDNEKAMAFYRTKGGKIGRKDIGNVIKAQDSVWFEFEIKE